MTKQKTEFPWLMNTFSRADEVHGKTLRSQISPFSFDVTSSGSRREGEKVRLIDPDVECCSQISLVTSLLLVGSAVKSQTGRMQIAFSSLNQLDSNQVPRNHFQGDGSREPSAVTMEVFRLRHGLNWYSLEASANTWRVLMNWHKSKRQTPKPSHA